MASTCQICLDIIEDGPDNSLLTTGCDENCNAQICRQCMGRHVEVTLQQFYPGVLPRVRCPICLTRRHLTQWKHRVPTDTRDKLVNMYNKLCRQACSLTVPCCHKADYTHLPTLNPTWYELSIKARPSQVAKYKNLCVEFCRHKLEPRAVLDFAFDTFGEEKAMVLVMNLTLPRIIDEERRATLLLSLMYLRPNSKTNCCGADFCFSCKRAGYHNSCEEGFDEDNDLVRCRNCRALLLKVDGCDAVRCVCGFDMVWSQEQFLRRERKRGLVPVDIFDRSLTISWLSFRHRQTPNMAQIWLQNCVITYRRQLRPGFSASVWRFRLRKVLANQLAAAFQARCAKLVDQHLQTVKPVLRTALSAYIWRKRFSNSLITMQVEMFWKAHHRWHPEELEATADEANALLCIAAFEEDE